MLGIVSGIATRPEEEQSLELYYLQLIGWTSVGFSSSLLLCCATAGGFCFSIKFSRRSFVVELIRPVMRMQHIGFSICCIIYYVQHRFN
jgi:hypothetical protein